MELPHKRLFALLLLVLLVVVVVAALSSLLPREVAFSGTVIQPPIKNY